MSRNKQQGKYAGKLARKHYRTHSRSVSVSVADCHIELFMKRQRENERIVKDFFESFIGGLVL